ncbi:hypothetical protein MBCUR_06350 [Methanobrevibacter curvatus]|uniref:Uncharacterized protein n=1 Tax=Methanobrevibacter curvatus TaxID=49547 RepID=A0A166CGH6_9EURY|nr:hypothetical protein MBCUR_06350 [Methanobrevibacter curvatus]
MESLIVTSQSAILIAPPIFALLLVNLQFIILVPVPLTIEMAPPSFRAKLLVNVESVIVKFVVADLITPP